MEFISHYIRPLVINSLGGGHTHTNTRIQMFVDKEILRNQVHAPGLISRELFHKFPTPEDDFMLPILYIDSKNMKFVHNAPTLGTNYADKSLQIPTHCPIGEWQ